MRKRILTLMVTPVLVLAVTACDDSQGGWSSEKPVDTDEVSVVDNEFEPAVIEVFVGETVTWTWEGSQPHDVDGGEFQSEVQTSGTFDYTFETAGEYQYVCNIHSGMKGTVVVTEQ